MKETAMKTRSALATSLAIIVITVIAILVQSSRLPARVPTHWNAQGQVDGYGSPSSFVLMYLGMSLFILLMQAGLPAISPKGYEINDWRPAFNTIMVSVVGFMSVVNLAILAGASGLKVDVTRLIFAIVLIGIGLLGLQMGKVKRNFWVGVRTPWTLASEDVWTATHHLAAKLMSAGGIGGGLLIALGVAPMPVFALAMALIIYPVFYSYWLYRRLNLNSIK